MSKIRLGKTKDSRTRKQENQAIVPTKESNAFTKHLLRKGFSTSSIKEHERSIERFSQWVQKENTTIESASYADVLHYVQSKRNESSQSTISKSVNSLKHYYDYLIDTQVVTENPTHQIQIKGIKRRMVYDILKPVELEAVYHHFMINEPQSNPKDNTMTQQLKAPSFQMQKVMLGLLIYQGITAQDLIKLQPQDIKLREGKVCIPGSRKSNERELKLEAVQILDMQEYLLKTRAEILEITQKESEQLFISSGKSTSLYHVTRKLTQTIKKQTPRIEDLQQIRASVIVKWLNNYNLRQAQYMAGHRFVSSTEKYKQSDLEDLKEDINKFHPLN